MIRAFKDSYNLSLLIAVIFFASILASGYLLFMLPYKLMLANGYAHVFTQVYIAVAISFALGGVALYLALKSQREIVVYRERTSDAESVESESNGMEDQHKTTITLEGVKADLSSATTEKDILQNGLHAVCKQLEAGQGALYLIGDNNGKRKVELRQGYALSIGENANIAFDPGEGLVGQSALSGQTLYLDDVPEGYIKIISGLGSASPKYLLIVAVKQNEKILGVMEIASFAPLSEDQRKFAEEAAQLIGEKL
jgi:hypothetical protein